MYSPDQIIPLTTCNPALRVYRLQKQFAILPSAIFPKNCVKSPIHPTCFLAVVVRFVLKLAQPSRSGLITITYNILLILLHNNPDMYPCSIPDSIASTTFFSNRFSPLLYLNISRHTNLLRPLRCRPYEPRKSPVCMAQFPLHVLFVLAGGSPLQCSNCLGPYTPNSSKNTSPFPISMCAYVYIYIYIHLITGPLHSGDYSQAPTLYHKQTLNPSITEAQECTHTHSVCEGSSTLSSTASTSLQVSRAQDFCSLGFGYMLCRLRFVRAHPFFMVQCLYWFIL